MWHVLSFMLGKYLGVEWPGHMVNECLINKKLIRNCQTALQTGESISHPCKQYRRVSVAPRAGQHLILSVFKILILAMFILHNSILFWF
jgi:hypothetical protein